MDDKDLKIIYKICDTKSLNEIHKEFNQYNKHTLKKLKSDFTEFKNIRRYINRNKQKYNGSCKTL